MKYPEQIKDLVAGIRKENSETFRMWLGSIPVCEYNNVKARLVELSGKSWEYFNNRRYAKCMISDSDKIIINQVAVEFSGKEIYTI